LRVDLVRELEDSRSDSRFRVSHHFSPMKKNKCTGIPYVFIISCKPHDVNSANLAY
jgi:hypothetical protein